MRALLKSVLLVLHLAIGVALTAAIAIDFRRKLKPEKLAKWWSARLLRILDIEVHVHGRGVAGPRVLVANHISWLDIPVLAALEETRFVAKSEVREWPIAGWFAIAAGTFFIRRGKGGAKPLLAKALPHLRAGGSFLFFPEGTTTAGNSVLKFHPRLFSAAIDAGCPVQPIALRYELTARGEAVAPFIGDDDLVSHILRVLRTPALAVQITYCPAITPDAIDRDAMASQAQAAIARNVTPVVATLPAEELPDLLPA